MSETNRHPVVEGDVEGVGAEGEGEVEAVGRTAVAKDVDRLG
jgi:hypothetical protein